jgi:virginiamycin A acetyltransferase
MNGTNHKLDGFSRYPFQIFGNGWEKVAPQTGELPCKGDAVIGNDVWIGYEAVMMPGVQMGDGASIAAKSVVVGDVLPYTIVGGNPAKCIRQHFEDDVIRALLKVACWNWDIEKITRNLEKIVGADIEALINCE